MHQHPSGRVCAPVIRPLVLAISLLAPALPVSAADAAPSERRSYQIPAVDLADALNRFAADAGVELVFDPREVPARPAPAIDGSYTVQEGFERLLNGSGLRAVQKPDGAWTLAKEPGGAAVLSAVKVRSTALETTVTEGTGSLTTAGPVAAATGLGLSLRETPQSVTVITRERIEQQNLNSLAEVAEQVTGVYYNGRGTPIGGRTLMYARGYEVDSYQIDGVNVPWEALAESERYGHGSLDTAIYDSVTVVRGSTGLMTGAGDPSALMALTRKKPTQESQVLLEATAGSWDRYRAMADVGGPLNEAGTLRGRVVGAYDEGKSWVDGYSSDRSIVYGVLEADFGARTLATLTLERGTADSQGAPWAEDYGNYLYFADGVTRMPKSRSDSIAPHWARLSSDRTYVSAALDHQFNDDWRARLSYGYGEFNSDMRRGMVSPIEADGSPVIARVLDLDYSYDTHIFDARIDGKYRLFGREHELVAGFNSYRNDQAAPLGVYDDRWGLGVVSGSWSDGRLNYTDTDWDALRGTPGDYPYDIEVRQKGTYLATRLRPIDRLAVIVGGRLTTWEYFYADRATPDHDYYVDNDLTYSDEFTPYVGVVVDLADTLSIYASYTQIFKPQEVRDRDDNLLDPEEGDTYEVGVKGAWFENRLNASVAVFESRRDNLAVALEDENGPVLTPNGDQAYGAEDETKGRGWEFEVSGALTPRWQIQAGYAYFRNKDKAGDVIDPTQPEQQFKLYTAYQPALMPKLTVGGSVRWQDGTHVDGNSDSLYKLDSHFVVGANADYALSEQLSLSLNIDNALDKEYRVSNYSHTYGAPRNATVSLRAKF